MYGFLNSAAGFARLRATGTQKEEFLSLCAAQGAEPLRAEYIDDVTVELSVPLRKVKKAEEIARITRCEVQVLKSSGAAGKIFKRRAAAILMAVAAVFLVFASTVFIWEIEISGNEKVSDAEILAALRLSGVEIGKCWLNLTSDNVRSEVVYRLPDLAWITVNIYGSRAEVIVRERIQKPEMFNDAIACDIVAEKSGFVTGVMALVGSAVAQRGDAVNEGDVLISGVVESPFGAVRALHAFGSIRAMTYNELTGVMPDTVRCKNYNGRERDLWSISLFGKRINFYGKGSISYADCDKIKNVWTLGIQGAFSLPVSITRETLRFYDVSEECADAAFSSLAMGQILRDYLAANMREGEIFTQNFTSSQMQGCLCVCLRASCAEEIGVAVPLKEARLSAIMQEETTPNTQKENE